MLDKDLISIIEQMYEGVYIVDRNRKIIFWNKGSENISGYSEEEVLHSHCYNDILRHVDESGKSLCHNGCPLLNTIQTKNTNEASIYLHHKEGHRVPVTVKSIPLLNEKGEVYAAIEVFTDTRFKENKFYENRKLKEELVKDPLTNLYNRRYLDFYLKNIQEESETFKTNFGMLFFDIDYFKNINDTYGHNVGDGVLKTIAMTLKNNVRTEDVIGRWGGEEFIGVIKNVSLEGLNKVSEKLRILCKNSVFKMNDGNEIKVTISIGGTMYSPGESIEDLIERADSLMYESKDTGRDKSTIK